VHQPGAATGRPLTLRTGAAVGSGTHRITAPPPSRRQQCTLARAAAAAAARRCCRRALADARSLEHRGRWSTADSGWYAR